jgi:ribosomal protein S2
VDVAIPANDDSIKAIEILLDQLAGAVAEGKTMVREEDVTAMAAQRPSRTRSRRRVLASAQDEVGEAAVETQTDEAVTAETEAQAAESSAQ